MARLTTLAFTGSLVLHGAAYASLGFAPRRGAHLPPASVTIEVTEPVMPVAEPEPPPPPPPVQEEPVPVARAAAPAPPPAPEPPPPAAPAPVDLSGLTLTNGDGEGGWSSPTGDGSSRSGPLGPLGPKPKAAAPVVASSTPKAPALAPAAGEPALVASRDLSDRPKPPALDALLKAHYPAEARNRAISGTASLRVRIESDGRVRTASVLSESFDGFGAACKKALIGSTWSPPRDQSGRAVATEVRYTCRFVVE